MVSTSDVTHLRFLGLIDDGAGESEVGGAVVALGRWLCPRGGVALQARAAVDYLQRLRPAPEPSIAAGGWTLSALVQTVEGSAALEVFSLSLDGSRASLGKFTTNARGELTQHMNGQRPELVVVTIDADGSTVTVGPLRTQETTWVRHGAASSARREGQYEVQRRWLAEVQQGVLNPDEAALSAHTGLSLAELQQHRVAQSLAKGAFKGPATLEAPVPRKDIPIDNSALAFALVGSCCTNEDLSGADPAVGALRAIAVLSPRQVANELERALTDRVVGEANRAATAQILASHRIARRDAWLALNAGGSTSLWGDVVSAAGIDAAALVAEPELFDASFADVWPRLVERRPENVKLAWADLAGFDHRALPLYPDDLHPREAINRFSPRDLGERVASLGADRVAQVTAALEQQFPGHSVLWELRSHLGEGAAQLFSNGLLELDALTVALWEGTKPGDPISAVRGREKVAIPKVTPEARGELMGLQRLLRVGKTKATTLALHAAGYRSAHEIALESEQEFARRMTASGVAPGELRELRVRAIARQRAATNVYLEHHAMRTGLRTHRDAQVISSELVQRLPALSNLFGSLDSCECEACESVLSLSAYLVDQLLWLSKLPVMPSGKAYDVLVGPPDTLIGRRRDLALIELSCQNSETQIPHIDIVCELLEDQVAATLSMTRSPGFQTVGTAEEVRAYPEHLNTDVYDKLLLPPPDSYWPFDVYLEEGRAYLAQAGAQRAEVLRAFSAANGDALTAERLGLSEAQLKIVGTADTSPAAQLEIWGAAAANLTLQDLLDRGDALLGRPLAYETLIALLGSKFITARAPVTIVVNKIGDDATDLCKASQRVPKYGPPAALTPLKLEELDRLHRLLRLSRSLDADPLHVVGLVNALGGTLAADTLAPISCARAAGVELGVPVLELAAFWERFDTTDGTPLQRLYRSIFFPDGNVPTGQLATITGRLAASLGVASDALGRLISALGASATSADETSLATLFRHVRLAEALGLSLDAYLVRRKYFDDPLAAKKPEQLFAFIELGRVLAEMGLDDARLDQMLSNARRPEGLELLWAGLQGARARYQDIGTTLPATFVADGAWRQPLTGWLGIAAGAVPAALDHLFARHAVLLQKVADWAARGNLQQNQPLPAFIEPSSTELAALRALGRFASLFSVEKLRPDLVVKNPGIQALTERGDGLTLLDYILLQRAAIGASSGARAQFSSKPVEKRVELEKLLGLSSAEVTTLLDGVDINASLAEQWSLVERRLSLARRLRFPLSVLADVSVPSKTNAPKVRGAYQSTVSRTEWLSASKTVQDALRPRRRDALLGFLLARTKRSAQQLSDELLIDVLTGPFQSRTRIGEASAAIQAFVNRILLGVESKVARTNDVQWNDWIWRKRYALWKGNRTVFLFPENYLSDSKRASASPLFRRYQETVARGELNDANVSEALVTYLDGLSDVSDLEYVAVGSDYNSNDDTGYHGKRELSVIARTRGTPGRYYFSRLAAGVWSAFEELSLGEDPAHVALYSAPPPADPSGTERSTEQRHILVWPKATLMPRPNAFADTSTQGTTADTVLSTKFAWTMRHGLGDWSPVKTTSSAVLFNGSKIADRRMLISLSVEGDVMPGEFGIVADLPPNNPPVNERAMSLISSVTLRRDVLKKVSYTNTVADVGVESTIETRKPANWSGPSPADELRADYLATSSAKFEANKEPRGIRVWPGLHFDQSRMHCNVSPDSPRGEPLVVPFTNKTLLKPISLYSVTRLGKRDLSIESPLPHPSAWAFFVSGASWSFFVVQKDLPPSGTGDQEGLGKAALGLAADNFVLGKAYSAVPAYHPFAHPLLTRVRDRGLEALYTRQMQRQPATALNAPKRQFKETLGLQTDSVHVPSNIKNQPATEETIDFSGLSPYGNYNFELFLFAPLLVSSYLRAKGAYPAARRFLHFIFNPLESQPGAGLGAPWWVTAAFDDVESAQTSLERILREGVKAGTNPYLPVEQSPFDAHAVAWSRRPAYQRFVVMEYLRCHLDWADSLYRLGRDENVDEASQLYMLADQLLGSRPRSLPPVKHRKARAFVKVEDWKPGGNQITTEVENLVGEVGSPPRPDSEVEAAPHLPLIEVEPGQLYFSVPRNDVLLGFYDRVGQALKNIRTWKSLDGSIASGGIDSDVDVQALVNAASAGAASIAQALSPTDTSDLGPRFRVLVAKAIEVSNDVRALGAAVQAAAERQDAEHLAAIRSTWEGRVLAATKAGLEKRRTEAEREVDVLEASRSVITARHEYYASRKRMSESEQQAFDLTIAGTVLSGVSSGLEIAGAALSPIPDLTVGISGIGGSPVSTIKIGGSNLGGGLQAAARGISSVGGIIDRTAGMVSTQAGYDRRNDDWQHQADQAQRELTQVSKQIEAARLRVKIAEADLATMQKQQASAKEQDDFLLTKYTTEDLFMRLLEETSKLHAKAYELAFDLARRAKEAYEFELPDEQPPALGSTWNPKFRGALAAEELILSLRQLEADHLKLYRTQISVTRTLSLRDLDSAQLIALRMSGTCKFKTPGWWLSKLDGRHQRKRVRSVAISVPCISGPTASVNATFSVTSATKSPVKTIHLSTGVNDPGWDLSTRAESYVPFEGVDLDGEAEWSFHLPDETSVDRRSIADVVVTLEYTAVTGTSSKETTPSDPWKVELDLARDDPRAWQALTQSPVHQASIDAADFRPSVLTDWKLGDASGSALDSTGTVVSVLTVGTTETTTLLQLSVATAIDWTKVARVSLTVNFAKP